MSQLSYAAGPAEPPVPEGTIGEWLDRAAERFADREALVVPWQDVRWTWAELRRRAAEAGAGRAIDLVIGRR